MEIVFEQSYRPKTYPKPTSDPPQTRLIYTLFERKILMCLRHPSYTPQTPLIYPSYTPQIPLIYFYYFPSYFLKHPTNTPTTTPQYITKTPLLSPLCFIDRDANYFVDSSLSLTPSRNVSDRCQYIIESYQKINSKLIKTEDLLKYLYVHRLKQ